MSENISNTDQAKQSCKAGVNGSFLYSIQILEKERNLIKECLSNWEKENYPEAKKEREQRLKDINNALEKLKYENTGENRNF